MSWRQSNGFHCTAVRIRTIHDPFPLFTVCVDVMLKKWRRQNVRTACVLATKSHAYRYVTDVHEMHCQSIREDLSWAKDDKFQHKMTETAR